MAHNNKVELSGRLSSPPEVKVLPSGDELVAFRLVIRRSPQALKRSKQVVDTIECVVWAPKLQRKVLGWEVGIDVSVTGELRRRFTSGGGSVASFVSVEVLSCRRLSRSAVASTA